MLWFRSDTSTTPPESCIFGLMTFITACAGIASMKQLSYATLGFSKISAEDSVTANVSSFE